MDLGGAIAMLREYRGLKQQDLAFHVGISSTSMSLIESNKSSPKHNTMVKIAAALEVPLPIIYLKSLRIEDITPDKLPAFWAVMGGVHTLLEELY